ncbi:PIN domain-containing protein [Hyphobacterium sp. CCMP332]|nr:PIN domain-containing protein [Hyphobacterium sp. CCMP332]
MKVLVDTDVILDVFLDREPFSSHASELLSLGETGKIQIFITAIAISNIYYTLKKRFNHKKIMNQLQNLMDIVEISPADKSVILESIQSSFSDFEDSLQHFSAKNISKVDYIITRNIKDYKFSEIKVFTPEKFLKSHF